MILTPKKPNVLQIHLVKIQEKMEKKLMASTTHVSNIIISLGAYGSTFAYAIPISYPFLYGITRKLVGAIATCYEVLGNVGVIPTIGIVGPLCPCHIC